MRRTALALVLLALAAAFAAGCGGEEEVTPTPDTVSGSLPTETEPTETEPTETEPTETEPTDTEPTETEPTETEPTETEPPAEGDPVAGKQVFLGSSACGTCHTLSDAGTSGTIGPNLDETTLEEDDIEEQVREGGGGMPSFEGQLSDDEIEAVAEYVASQN